ncbi:MAG: NDP-sugar synthase [Acidobacteriota bacterium]|nr:MAG: NDP-sugar synthase [Acidobacteriota bacterium]
MQALILAGGRGTRLRPLTVYTPKPIVPMLNRPFVLYQIEMLREAGIYDITLSLSYQPDKIELLLGNGAEHGVSLRYITEPMPMGTGGAYKFAAGGFRETTIVLNGDILTDLDLKKMVRSHAGKKADATIAVHKVEDPTRYGLVKTDEDGKVVGFIEKPDTDIGINTINAGIYILEPTILDLIAKDENLSFEYDVFPEILKKRLAFYAFFFKKEYWKDIGTPESYWRAHMDMLEGKLARLREDDAGPDAPDVATHASVDKASVIGKNCTVKPGAVVVNSVLGEGVLVEERAVVENAVIWPYTRISVAAEIRDSVIGKSCHVGRNASVSSGSVIGDKSTLTDYTRV